jgi:hypothetical protein
MVRPKASDENLAAALAFANILIIRKSMNNNEGTKRVHRKGSRSLYAAFRACIPELARNSEDQNPKNRSAVTCVEFNKIMHWSGLESIRRRDRSRNGVKWTLKVVEVSFHLRDTTV